MSYEDERLRVVQELAVDNAIRSARMLMNMGDYEQALRHLTVMAKKYPKAPDLYYTIGECHYAIDEVDLAILAFKQELLIDPTSSASQFNVAYLLGTQGKATECVECYEDIIRRDPDFYRAYNNLSAIYDQLGNTEKGIDLLKSCLAKFPTYAAGWDTLGNLCASKGRKKEAIEAYKNALKHEPDHPYARASLKRLKGFWPW